VTKNNKNTTSVWRAGGLIGFAFRILIGSAVLMGFISLSVIGSGGTIYPLQGWPMAIDLPVIVASVVILIFANDPDDDVPAGELTYKGELTRQAS
jgi:hypothetical protein